MLCRRRVTQRKVADCDTSATPSSILQSFVFLCGFCSSLANGNVLPLSLYFFRC